MKSIPLISMLFCCIAGPALAGFEMWTDKEGRSATLKLIGVQERNGEKVGSFEMESGEMATIPQSALSENDAQRMALWKPKAAGPPSVFDDFLRGNLVRLKDNQFVPETEWHKPLKYYVFYYSASWCAPCKKFTPSLVRWYNDNKNDNFELFLISQDGSEEKMLTDARSKKMPWPQLPLEKGLSFRSKFHDIHDADSLPCLIVCQPDGTVLGNFRGRLPQLSEMIR